MNQRLLPLVALLWVTYGCTPRALPSAPANTLFSSEDKFMTAPLPSPPVAARHPSSTTLFGDTRVDDYAWLQNKKAPEVRAYLEAENAYANALTKGLAAQEQQLFEEIVERIQQTDSSVPARQGKYLYYSRTEEGKQYRIYCRRENANAPEQVLLDLNELAKGHSFLGLGAFEVSNDGQWLAYSLDTTGFRRYTLHVKNLGDGSAGPEAIDGVKSLAWAADNRTLFYTVDDHAKRPYRVYRHRLSDNNDALLYEEKDERFRVWVRQSRSQHFVFLGSSSHVADEVRFIPANAPESQPVLIAERAPNFEYSLSHSGEYFYIRTNDKGRNFRVVRTPVARPDRENWAEWLPHSAQIMRADVDLFENFAVVSEREAGLPHLRVVDLKDGQAHRIPLPEPVYSVSLVGNYEFSTGSVRYSYTSMTTPKTVIDYKPVDRSKNVRKVDSVKGYDPTQYISTREWAVAADGSKIPISTVRRKDVPLDGSAPLLLLGYGSYGYSYPTSLNRPRISLVDRGMIVAIAHIRGGGEMGKAWHDKGRMEHKLNTFTDYIASAEHLLAQKYTRSERLIASGGSAGGLLMGAVSNLRPELFGLVMSYVPFVDVLNTMLNDDLPLTVGEYEEWGNPNVEEEYFRIKSYCPYSNIKEQAYPTMLIRTSFNDSQVMYWEPAKYVAKLRAHKRDQTHLLLRTNMAGGHGGASGRLDQYREDAADYAFMLNHLKATH